MEAPSKDTLLDFISNSVTLGLISAQFSLKNSASFDIPVESEGQLLIGSENTLIISIPITAQNGYGNTIISKALIFDGKGHIVN